MAGTPTPEATVARAPAASIRIYPLGQTAAGEIGEATIHNVRFSSAEGAARPPEGHQWMLFDVALRNLGTEPQQFHVRLVNLLDEEVPRAYPPGVIGELDTLVEGGAELRGEIAFLVTVDRLQGVLFYGIGDVVWALQLGMIRQR
jgi:hypothetical protein